MDQIRVLLHRYLVAGWRYRWVALALAWVVSLGGWFAVYLIPNQFEAKARMFVDADAVLTPLLRGLAIDSGTLNEVEMLQRTLLSAPNIDKLISRTSLELQISSPIERERLVQALQTQIAINPQTHNLFTISYRNPQPKLALEVVQTLITIFIEKATGSNRTSMDNAEQFLGQQISAYEDKLRAAEKRRADFRTKFMDLLPNDLNGGLTRLEMARSQIEQLGGVLQDAQAKRDMLAKELAATPPTVSAAEAANLGGAGGGGNPELVQARRHLEELRLRFTDQYPDVIAQKKFIEMLEKAPPPAHAAPRAAAPKPEDGAPAAPAKARGGVPNPVYEHLKVLLVDAEAALASTKRQLAETDRDRSRLEAVLQKEPLVQAEFQNLDRDYTVLQQNYQQLLERREQMRLSAAADREADKIKLQIVDPPEMPRVPVAPKRGLLFSGVLLVGLGAGAGLALLLAQLDRSFPTVEDLRDLGLPVVGGISLLGPVQRTRNFAGSAVFALGLVLLGALYGGLMSGLLHIPRVI